MEPGPHGREEPRVSSRRMWVPSGPQWSPALTAGKSSRQPLGVGRKCSSRNGARPSRPGRGARGSGLPSCPDRGRNGARPSRPGRGVLTVHDVVAAISAAMEPGPHGREEVRRSMISTSRMRSRNGARPSRPGRVADPMPISDGGARAAMEPGPHGREEASTMPVKTAMSSRPQWSPALTAGKSRFADQIGMTPAGLPQWSPALTAGKSPMDRARDILDNKPQWSPALTAGKSRW